MSRPIQPSAALALLLTSLLFASGTTLPVGAQATHDPIALFGNAELADLVATEGLPGSGTANDPYVLSDLHFAPTADTTAIYLSGISKHLLVRNITVTGGAIGVHVTTSPHVTIADSTFDDPGAGIVISGQATARNNQIEAGTSGIYVLSGHAAVVEANTIHSTPVGIQVRHGDDVQLVDNHISGTTTGIHIRQGIGSRLAGNTIDTTIKNAIELDQADDVRLTDTRVDAARRALFADRATITLIDGFTVTNSTEGLVYSGTHDVTANDIRVTQALHGLYLSQSHRHSYTNVYLEDNTIGLSAVDSHDLHVTGGTLIGNDDGIKNFIGQRGVFRDLDVVDNKVGLRLASARNGEVHDSNITGNDEGVRFDSSSNGRIENNVFRDNGNGLYINRGRSNTIFHNQFWDDTTALRFNGASSNLAYDNLFHATDANLELSGGSGNTWSTEPHPGRNILGGIWRGGNWWSDATTADLDGDGVGDVPHLMAHYQLDQGSISPANDNDDRDEHPLTGGARVMSPLL